MLSIDEKILLLDERIIALDDICLSILKYIKNIEDGMEDPEMTISQCNQLLLETQVKKEALIAKKQHLLEDRLVV